MRPYDGLTEQHFILKKMPQPYLPGTPAKETEIRIGLSNWGVFEKFSKKDTYPMPEPRGTPASSDPGQVY